MKIKYEFDETLTDDTIIIRFHPKNPEVEQIKEKLEEVTTPPLKVYQKDREIFISALDVLFFETSGDIIYAHSAHNNYQIKMRLYEIEALNPTSYSRVSKSTIININQIYSIEKTFGAGGLIKFRDSHKEVYVSRLYYKLLKEKLKGRLHYEKK